MSSQYLRQLITFTYSFILLRAYTGLYTGLHLLAPSTRGAIPLATVFDLCALQLTLLMLIVYFYITTQFLHNHTPYAMRHFLADGAISFGVFTVAMLLSAATRPTGEGELAWKGLSILQVAMAARYSLPRYSNASATSTQTSPSGQEQHSILAGEAGRSDIPVGSANHKQTSDSTESGGGDHANRERSGGERTGEEHFQWLRVTSIVMMLSGAITTWGAWYFALPKFNVNSTISAILVIASCYMILGLVSLLMFVHERTRRLHVPSRLFGILVGWGVISSMIVILALVFVPYQLADMIVLWRHRWPLGVLPLLSTIGMFAIGLIVYVAWAALSDGLATVGRGMKSAIKSIETAKERRT